MNGEPNFDFDELVEGASPEERARLRRVHDLLVSAGPPPELPPALTEPPGAKRAPERERAPILTTLPRRRLAATLTAALGVALAAFGVGYLFGAGNEDNSRGALDVDTIFTLEMDPTDANPRADGVLRVGREEEGGNIPLVLTVTGLVPSGDDDYYELWLTRKGRRVLSCGTFVADKGDVSVRLNAAYTLETFAGWVVTRHVRGQKATPEILRTVA